VKYFNGFSLSGEASLFASYVIDTAYTVAGFSFGAQKALEYTYASENRIDRLILLSPAFFQTEKPSFIRTQLRYFESDKAAYVKNFLDNVCAPSTIDISKYLYLDSREALEQLLCYQWESDKIETLVKRGVEIEVYFGAQDKIIDVSKALAFFTQTTNYILKDAGHLLRTKDD